MARSFNVLLVGILLSNMVVPHPVRAGGFSLLGPELLASDIGAGILGSVMGSLVQLPGAGGMLSTVAGRIPVMGAAMLLSHFGLRTIDLMRRGQFSFGNLVAGQDWLLLLAQTLGATLGSTMAAMLVPGPLLGVMVGAALGGVVLTKALEWARVHFSGLRYEASARGKPGSMFSLQPAMQGVVPGFSLEVPKGPVTTDDLSALEETMKQRYREFLHHSSEPARAKALQAYQEARTAYHDGLRAVIRQ